MHRKITCFREKEWLASLSFVVTLLPEFVFKGTGTRTHLVPPEGVNYQWAPKGSYRIKQMLGIIKKLSIDSICSLKRDLQYLFWMITQCTYCPKFDKPYLKKDISLLSLVEELLVIYKLMTRIATVTWRANIEIWRWI